MAPPPFRFTAYDLDSCIEVARVLKDRAGGQASAEALAVYLEYKGANNGAFLTRIANARLFGLVDGPSSALRLSKRAQDILQPDYPETAARARLEAFEAVPLYKEVLNAYHGQMLPDDTGMKNALETRWGVSKDKSTQVFARLMSSAEQAGLFKVAGNRSKMVRPPLSGSPEPSASSAFSGVNDGTSGGEGHGHHPHGHHPHQQEGVRATKLIDGVLDMLPNEQEWDEASLTHWLRFFEDALRLYYKLPRPVPPQNGAVAPTRAIAEGGGG